MGLSTLLLEDEESPLAPTHRESVDLITKSSDLLRTVVDDVLDYSKLEAGHLAVEIRRCNLQRTMESVINAIRVQGHKRKLILRTFYGSEVPEYVQSDGRRLQQILFNLLGNAVKFSHEGGNVDLRACLKKKKSTDNWDTLQLSVKDYGKGIHEKDIEKIFRPFHQTEEAKSQVQSLGGTGLGLSIAAKLVHGLGGTISVKSKINEWTEFIVDLPFNGDGVDSVAIAKKYQNTTVLLVGEEEVRRSIITDIFQPFDIPVEELNGCQELKARSNSHGAQGSSRLYLCLCQEDLYDRESYRALAIGRKVALVTFGPRNHINEFKNWVNSNINNRQNK